MLFLPVGFTVNFRIPSLGFQVKLGGDTRMFRFHHNSGTLIASSPAYKSGDLQLVWLEYTDQFLAEWNVQPRSLASTVQHFHDMRLSRSVLADQNIDSR